MRTIRRGVMAAAAILLLGGAAAAQTRRAAWSRSRTTAGGTASGARLGVGAGGEAFDLRDGAGYSGDLYRPTVSVRLGGTPSRYLRLGGEIQGWIDDQGNRTESLTSVLFIGQFYPAPPPDSTSRAVSDWAGARSTSTTASAWATPASPGLVGAGWEVRVGRRLYLNPAVDLIQHRYTGRGGDRYRERIVNFGIGVLFQSGR